jgi:hypothetical protein
MKLLWLVIEYLFSFTPMELLSSISSQEQVTFEWDDVAYVILEQRALLYF